MQTNCYLVYPSSLACAIIDPGDDADYIQRRIYDLGLTPKYVLATHGHFDHLLAAAELSLGYQIPFCLNRKDEFLLKKSLPREALAAPVVLDLKEGVEISLGQEKLKVLEIGGHTPGSVAFVARNDIFSGDAIFADGSVGRTDFGYSDKKMLEKGIARLEKFAKGATVWPGHGEEFRLV